LVLRPSSAFFQRPFRFDIPFVSFFRLVWKSEVSGHQGDGLKWEQIGRVGKEEGERRGGRKRRRVKTRRGERDRKKKKKGERREGFDWKGKSE